MQGGIPLKDVAKKYNSTKDIWNAQDYWHFYLHKRYKAILSKWCDILSDRPILNIGSANENYDIPNAQMIYLDAAQNQLPRDRFAVCGDAHRLPFRAKSFYSAIAIGSVLNYCAPAEFFNEVSRVLEDEGFLIFDFEQSGAFEHQGKDFFNKKAALFLTEFNDLEENIWVFQPSHIRELMSAAGFQIINNIYLHSISSLVWRLTENNAFTAFACRLDRIFSKLPFFQNRSSSIFIIARKTSSRLA